MNMADALHLDGLRGTLRRDEPMARHLSWRTGGAARRLYIPADTADLAEFLKTLPPREPILFIGLGSNLLVRDGGYAGTVVLMHAPHKRPELRDGRIYADAGVASPKVARFAARHDLGGAEFLSGIPGSIGGALAMNAGCFGGETWDIVEQAATIDRAGIPRLRSKEDFSIAYRHCALRDAREEWFTGAYFRLPHGDGEMSRWRIKELLARRIATQPLELPNAGSVFRNPEGDHAARLIEACGLKGLSRGGARVSEKHANFIVNPKGAASAADIESLIEQVQFTVKEKTSISLVPEVRIVGQPA